LFQPRNLVVQLLRRLSYDASKYKKVIRDAAGELLLSPPPFYPKVYNIDVLQIARMSVPRPIKGVV